MRAEPGIGPSCPRDFREQLPRCDLADPLRLTVACLRDSGAGLDRPWTAVRARRSRDVPADDLARHLRAGMAPAPSPARAPRARAGWTAADRAVGVRHQRL